MFIIVYLVLYFWLSQASYPQLNFWSHKAWEIPFPRYPSFLGFWVHIYSVDFWWFFLKKDKTDCEAREPWSFPSSFSCFGAERNDWESIDLLDGGDVASSFPNTASYLLVFKEVTVRNIHENYFKKCVFFFEGGRLLDVFVQFSMHGILQSPWKRHLVDVCSLFSISLLSRKIEHINPPDHVCGHAFVTVTIQPYAADVSGGFLAQGWCQSQSDDHMRADGFVLAPLKGVTQT